MDSEGNYFTRRRFKLVEMPRFKSMFFLGLAVAALVSLSLTALYLLFSKSYPEFINWILTSMHKLHLQQKATAYFSEQQFKLLRMIAVLFSLCLLLLIFWGYIKREWLMNRLQNFLEQVQSTITGFAKNILPSNKLNRILFLLLIGFYLVRSVVSILYYPIDFDEADTYMLFSSQGTLVSATFYPLPNNHILFSIITSITTLLPGDPVYLLRLPLLAIGVLCMFILYAFLKNQFTEEAALIGLGFFIASYPVVLYSFFARGYLLLLLCYIAALYAFFQITVSHKNNKRYYYLLAASSVAGFYTIPSFLYAFAGLLLFASFYLLFQKRNRDFFRLLKATGITGFITMILYIPVLIAVKWELLKPYLNPVYEKSKLVEVFQTTYMVLAKTFLSPYVPLAFLTGVFLTVGSAVLLRNKISSSRAIVLFVWLQLLLSMIVFFVFSQLFPAKPWIHFSVVVTLLFTAVVNAVIKRKAIHPFLLITIPLVLMTAGTFIGFNYKNNSSVAAGYNKVAKQCERLMIENNVREVYTDIPYFKTMIDYYSIKNKLQVTIYNSRKSSQRFALFDQHKKYDLIITYLSKSKLPPLLYSYDTVLQQNNTLVLLIRQSSSGQP